MYDFVCVTNLIIFSFNCPKRRKYLVIDFFYKHDILERVICLITFTIHLIHLWMVILKFIRIRIYLKSFRP